MRPRRRARILFIDVCVVNSIGGLHAPHKYTVTATRLCLQCNSGVEETVEHLALECNKYEHKRESLMDVVYEQYGENQWNARCVEGDSDTRYLVGLDEECNVIVVDEMKGFLVHAWSKRC
ncbi:hypothetical protein FHG87_015841 [Trinorchestia longiramus]|nr:hypothetical protein FHG87_015841 [Trinorchestia longiramus]